MIKIKFNSCARGHMKVNIVRNQWIQKHKKLNDIITVFMLIKCMIQLPQENAIPGILLERKQLSVIIFYESN